MLHVHRAERADGLVDALGDLLATPPADPFAAEVVAVPTRGMERWLTQRLSTGLGTTPGRADGVCANVEFPSPRRLVDDAVAVASGIEPVPAGPLVVVGPSPPPTVVGVVSPAASVVSGEASGSERTKK